MPAATEPRLLRTDIQGLRAIAVLVVVAAHAGVPGLAGGFVGVDVFFVISGFLISQLLFREASASGRIRLRDFYSRRARRILPAATLVTAVTVAASVVWLSVVQARDVVTDAWWATFFAANVRFAEVGTDYFAQGQAESPLRHYWSLAVEEQFYVVWPLLLLLVCVVGRRWRRGVVTLMLLVIGSASFAYGVTLTDSDPTLAYFSTPARAWELVVGALAALAVERVAGRPRWARSLVGAGGLAAIVVACVAFDGTTPFPGVAAALPVLGSAALLLAGAQPATEHAALATRLLGVRPLRAIGDWSYSLYLWHWPLLVLPATAIGEPLPAWGSAIAVLAAVVLGWLTYRFVETPWRRPREAPRVVRLRPAVRGLLLYPASVALVAATCLTAATYGDAQLPSGEAVTVAGEADAIVEAGGEVSEDPTVALVQASVVAARDRQEIPAELSPPLLDLRTDVADVADCDYTDEDVRRLCPRGDPEGDRTLVLLGSSHGRMWIPALEEIAQRAGYRAYYLVRPLCSAADVSSGKPYPDLREPDPDCDAFRQWTLDQVDELEPDLVVVATTPPGPFVFDADGKARRIKLEDPVEVRDGFDRLFDRLHGASERVVLIRDVPKLAQPAAECLTAQDADLGSCLSSPSADDERLTGASVRSANRSDVEVVDPRPWLCWDGECPAVIGAHVAYRDRDHLTTAYAAELADDLGRELGLWDEA